MMQGTIVGRFAYGELVDGGSAIAELVDAARGAAVGDDGTAPVGAWAWDKDLFLPAVVGEFPAPVFVVGVPEKMEGEVEAWAAQPLCIEVVAERWLKHKCACLVLDGTKHGLELNVEAMQVPLYLLRDHRLVVVFVGEAEMTVASYTIRRQHLVEALAGLEDEEFVEGGPQWANDVDWSHAPSSTIVGGKTRWRVSMLRSPLGLKGLR
ncbi:hypothetical protein NHH73_22725 [Oxalobacteraceae bacterium OTU3CINTB1]|nr:hypothetical protein NHH73_22725 [Oxalobacteraceae bacterium OTU3CINTB1]